MNKYLRQACDQRAMSKCKKLKVGAVFVKDGEVIGEGHNERLGNIECEECSFPDSHCAYALHAEQAAWIDAVSKSKDIKGADLYCTSFPCYNCMEMLYWQGVRNVFYINEYQREGR